MSVTYSQTTLKKIQTHTYTGHAAHKHAPPIPASWVCLGPKCYYYRCSRPRPLQQRPVALAASAVCAVRPCGAVCVAPRGASLRVPLRRLGGKTATEALTGYAPQVHRFRIFGCTAWALIHKEHRATKFSPRAKQGIFMGFSTKAPAYLVWVPGTRELVESPHVMFDETRFGGASPVAVC